MLRDLGCRIKDAGVLHIRDKNGKQAEYYEERKFRLRTRAPDWRDGSGHDLSPKFYYEEPPLLTAEGPQLRRRLS